MNPLFHRHLLKRLQSSSAQTPGTGTGTGTGTLSIPTTSASTLLYRTSSYRASKSNLHTISVSLSTPQRNEFHRHLTPIRPLQQSLRFNLPSPRLMSTAAAATSTSSHADSPIYSTHHPDEEEEVYTSDGWLFNQDPSRPCNDPVDRQLAILWTVTSILFIGYMAFMMHFKPETSMRRWAREEALERGVFVPPLRPDITDDDEL